MPERADSRVEGAIKRVITKGEVGYLNYHTIDLPSEFASVGGNLCHTTSYENALEMLRSGYIFGSDEYRHANFSHTNPREDLAKSDEVTIMFEWGGKQKVFLGNPFIAPGDSPIDVDFFYSNPKDRGGPEKDVLYHIIKEGFEDQELRELFFNPKLYWQSILFPGSSGLEFRGVHSTIYMREGRADQDKDEEIRKTLTAFIDDDHDLGVTVGSFLN